MQYYDDFEEKPEITATHGAFMLTLPNMNYIMRLKVKKTRAYTIIREMLNEGLIVKRGSGNKDGEYVLSRGTRPE